MMEAVEIKDAFKSKKVKIRGWVYDIRDLSKVRFLVVKDLSGRIQVTGVRGKTDDKIFDLMKGITKESAVVISGEMKDSKQAPGGKELLPSKIEVVGKADSDLPIDVSDYSKTELPKRLDNRGVDLRRRNVSAIFSIRSAINKSLVDFFYNEKFVLINTPKITTIGLESGAESFSVDYFKKKASLAQSPQFYKQMMVVGGLERVFEIGAVYRAEKSHTTRHLTEFTGVDFEMGFIRDENDVMDVIENAMKYIIKFVKKDKVDELKLLGVDLSVPQKIPRIPMSELKEVLSKKGKKLDFEDDLDSEAEKMIGEYVLKKYGEEFVFVTNYPWKVRPFYHMKPENDENGTRSFDLLWRGVEIATGAQREHRLDVLKSQAKEKGLKVDPIYAEIFKYGAPPHGGVGFGLDRITQRMLNLENVREAILLPRDPERLVP
tara:strand:- start:4472 stop:5770 length:1299 start_codon:yes stop_codon:yes gene_type:complete